MTIMLRSAIDDNAKTEPVSIDETQRSEGSHPLPAVSSPPTSFGSAGSDALLGDVALAAQLVLSGQLGKQQRYREAASRSVA